MDLIDRRKLIDFEIESARNELNDLLKTRQLFEGFTIDPKGARDLDDGFSVVHLSEGTLVVVSISDVAALVQKYSELDQVAFQRGFTQYSLDSRRPMLPPTLSEDILSLLPNQTRLTQSVVFAFDQNFSPIDAHTLPSSFKNTRKFTYLEASNAINDKEDRHYRDLNCLLSAADMLFEKRVKDSELSLIDLSNVRRVLVSETGALIRGKSNENAANFIVQEFMIAVGFFYAKQAQAHGKVIPFRNHRHSDGRTYNEWCAELRNSTDSRAREILKEYRRNAFILPRANYGESCEGHCGLGGHYAHSTSPIRRYVDIEVQRGFAPAVHLTSGQANLRLDHINELNLNSTGKLDDIERARRYKTAEVKFNSDPKLLTPDEFGHLLKFALEGRFARIEEFCSELRRRLKFGQIEGRDVARIFVCTQELPLELSEIRLELLTFCAQNWFHNNSILWPATITACDKDISIDTKPKMSLENDGVKSEYRVGEQVISQFGPTASAAAQNARAAVVYSLINAEEIFYNAQKDPKPRPNIFPSWCAPNLVQYLADIKILNNFRRKIEPIPGKLFRSILSFSLEGHERKDYSDFAQSKGGAEILSAHAVIEDLVELNLVQRNGFGIEIKAENKVDSTGKAKGVPLQHNAVSFIYAVADRLHAQIQFSYEESKSIYKATLNFKLGDRNIQIVSKKCSRKDLAKYDAAKEAIRFILEDPIILDSLNVTNFKNVLIDDFIKVARNLST